MRSVNSWCTSPSCDLNKLALSSSCSGDVRRVCRTSGPSATAVRICTALWTQHSKRFATIPGVAVIAQRLRLPWVGTVAQSRVRRCWGSSVSWYDYWKSPWGASPSKCNYGHSRRMFKCEALHKRGRGSHCNGTYRQPVCMVQSLLHGGPRIPPLIANEAARRNSHDHRHKTSKAPTALGA
jgi:hypothetical protein